MNIYVGNLPASVTEESLRQTFESYGRVSSAAVIMDKYTGRPRGFGFVEMPDDIEANSAIQAVNNMDWEGQMLIVREAYGRQRKGRGDLGSSPGKVRELSDRLEIQDTLIRYCTAIDSKDYDKLDSVFTTDAFIDYTSAGGIKGALPEVKEWLSKALQPFPVTQHVVGNFNIQVDGDNATSRCAFYNPMGLRMPGEGEELRMLFFGGYYNDKLVRAEGEWRISERIEESVWKYGEFPEGFTIPE